jgi:glycine/D-amino acid oxidase-like deaminating enzyme
MDDDPAELALSNYSLRLWQRFADLPQAEFSRCGTLWVAREPRELDGVAAKVARLAVVGVRAQRIEAEELYRLEPELVPGLCGGMRVPDEAVVYPPRVAMHLLDLARGGGAHCYLGRRVVALTANGARLDDGSELSGPVLLATGCALPQLLPQLPMRTRKGHLVITERYPGRVRHQLLELGYADSAHGDADSSVAFNVQPRPTGQILIGSSREFGVEDRAVSMPMLRRMLERAFAFLPMLRELQALRVWTGFRPTTADGRPYIGAAAVRADTWVAAGHEGLGVTTALATAQMLIDQILRRAPEIDPAPFLPERVLR